MSFADEVHPEPYGLRPAVYRVPEDPVSLP